MPVIDKLSDIVTPEELRAMLGVGVKEFGDPVVDLPVYKRSVKITCDRTDSRIWSLYSALPADTTSWSADQQNFSDLFQTYLAWATARMLAIALPQFSPQGIGDGKALMQRNDDASESVIANIDKQISDVVLPLVNAAEVLQPSLAAQVKTAFVLGKFGATGDPVTG